MLTNCHISASLRSFCNVGEPTSRIHGSLVTVNLFILVGIRLLSWLSSRRGYTPKAVCMPYQRKPDEGASQKDSDTSQAFQMNASISSVLVDDGNRTM
mmetsp:Transcript_2199/g.4587  ORF Transcript_2199/g.4587 Transcript_2199/m.4587 type:complete len:98 (+) Transcript_2199:270-563(+)